MADIQPFRGLRYDPNRIGDLSRLITPPYDVLSPTDQLRYHQTDPYNVIRLDYGLERAADSMDDNRYTRAATAMARWLEEGVLIRDETPALYLVEHRFKHQDEQKSRFSLIARVRLEDSSSGLIRPHERTMQGPSEDRLRLLRSCNANISPIMGLFRHRREGIETLFQDVNSRPLVNAADEEGVSYSMWMITDEEAVATAHDLLAEKALYIADGHHRYATALLYRQEQLAKRPSATGSEPFNFVMMTLTPAEDPNLVMLPTHRLLRGLDPKMLSRFKEEWNTHFSEELLPPQGTPIETVERWTQSLQSQRGTTFGLYGLDGPSLRLLRARPEMMLPVQPNALGDLDVFILHQVILRQMLGLDQPEREEECLDYTRDGLDAIARIDAGEYQLAFLINPTPISSILAVADEGVRMPQKSTYFHPKTPTGLVINPLWED